MGNIITLSRFRSKIIFKSYDKELRVKNKSYTLILRNGDQKIKKSVKVVVSKGLRNNYDPNNIITRNKKNKFKPTQLLSKTDCNKWIFFDTIYGNYIIKNNAIKRYEINYIYDNNNGFDLYVVETKF